MNKLYLFGIVKRINVTEPKSHQQNKGPSAIIVLQYGAPREQSGGPVEFINAVQVRIPNYRYAQIKDSLSIGSILEISGHVQGVLKPTGIDGQVGMTVELVADLVSLKNIDFLLDTLHTRQTPEPPTSP